MMNKTGFMLVALASVSVATFGARERVVRFQNHVRVGYDDNVYQTDDDKQDTMFITDIVNLSAKINISSRTDALLYWQPEFRYRFDADPELVSYQDLYARLNHAVSQRAFVTLSDRFRYQDKDGQSDLGATPNQNYLENELMGAVDYTLSSLSLVKVGAGYELRRWDEEAYGGGDTMTGGNNDYDQITADASYIRDLKANTTQGILGANYVTHAYNGDRGGFDSVAGYLGVDQNFNPNVTGNARVGYSFSDVDTGSDNTDSTSPYLQAGLDFNPTSRTTLNGSVGYSVYRAENSIYNAQDRFNLALGARQDITAKISLAGSMSYTHSMYDADYTRDSYTGVIEDANDDYIVLSLRASYQVNRNNFLEAGYEYSVRMTDTDLLGEYNRNVFDIGWRLRL